MAEPINGHQFPALRAIVIHHFIHRRIKVAVSGAFTETDELVPVYGADAS